MGTTAEWVSVSIGLPPEVNQAAEKINQVLETVSTILEIVNAILDIIKIFIVDLLNPLKIIIKALLAIIEQLINDPSSTPWEIVPGATGLTFNPGFVSTTTCYQRCARRAGCRHADPSRIPRRAGSVLRFPRQPQLSDPLGAFFFYMPSWRNSISTSLASQISSNILP